MYRKAASKIAAIYLASIDQVLINKAKKYFGTTYSPREGGYILPDGSMLDFSGRHEIPSQYNQRGTVFEVKPGKKDLREGQRDIDHRAVNQILDEHYDSPTNAMLAFQARTGAVRLVSSSGVSFVVRPTEKQLKVITLIWSRYHRREPLYVDIDRASGGRIRSFSLPPGFSLEDLKNSLR